MALASICWPSFLPIFFAFLVYLNVNSAFEFKHHNNEELPDILDDVHVKCPDITRVYSLDEESVREVPLYVIEFSLRPGHHELMKPEFKYIANIHGNEVLGRELLLKLADYLCEQWNLRDLEIVALIKNTRIHLLPSMNPDGWQLATDTGGKDFLIGRTNNNSMDLNRNFPDLNKIAFSNEKNKIYRTNLLLEEVEHLRRAAIQPETKAVMRLLKQVPFVLSATFHGGELVANYPYDESRSGVPFGEYTSTPDDNTFRHLAQTYSTYHADMADPNRLECDRDSDFGEHGGITNGAKWYSLEGGMQDFSYLSSNDFDITLEIGCEKYPPAEVLPTEWTRNKDALIYYIWQSHIGIKGMVYSTLTNKGLSNAIIHVQNVTDPQNAYDIDHDITSASGGDYFRLLTPGKYKVTAYGEGYLSRTKTVVVRNVHGSPAKRVDFRLKPITDNKQRKWRRNMGD